MGNRAYVPKMNVATQTSPTNVVRGNSPQYNRDERFMVGEEMHRQRPHPIKVLHPDAEDYILSEIPIAPIDVSSLKRIAENPNIGVNPDRDERVATAVVTTSSLPSQCSSYATLIPDAARYYNYTGPGNCSGLVSPQDCTTAYPNGWYRIQSASYGTTITTTPPTSLCHCGAQWTGWWNGILPTTPGQTTSASLCYWG
ncbi:unnamed protein product [Rotaria magnacalcarata]|uniref:Uncharacterized protein n=1 Tax=Rotaria magnacalcarata TaxID=392030 RepID=A0A815PKU8_9BILA|nr:unnamed protein product [Rotaria magnacalcarata]CAF1965530.1 unnamed protein product [Rotaria magnacalcarata]